MVSVNSVREQTKKNLRLLTYTVMGNVVEFVFFSILLGECFPSHAECNVSSGFVLEKAFLIQDSAADLFRTGNDDEYHSISPAARPYILQTRKVYSRMAMDAADLRNDGRAEARLKMRDVMSVMLTTARFWTMNFKRRIVIFCREREVQDIGSKALYYQQDATRNGARGRNYHA